MFLVVLDITVYLKERVHWMGHTADNNRGLNKMDSHWTHNQTLDSRGNVGRNDTLSRKVIHQTNNSNNLLIVDYRKQTVRSSSPQSTQQILKLNIEYIQQTKRTSYPGFSEDDSRVSRLGRERGGGSPHSVKLSQLRQNWFPQQPRSTIFLIFLDSQILFFSVLAFIHVAFRSFSKQHS